MRPSVVLPLLKSNWKPALTVALISLPLSIALSIASGAGPIPGIITGIWAPLVAAIFGSSHYNIIGVAGALTTLLFAAAVTEFNGQTSLWLLPILAITVGLIILLIYALRLERFLRYIPSAVVYGFATGVAVLIAAGQLFDAVGLSFLAHTGHFIGDIEVLGKNLNNIHWPSLIVFLIFFAGLLTWKRYIKFLPGVIPATAVGALLGWLDTTVPSLNLGLITLVDKFGSVKAQLVQVPDFGRALDFLLVSSQLKWLLTSAFIIAIVAVLETLITARIGDKMTKTEHSPRRELRGLGLANIAAGVTGGLPSTGVFLRTGINIKSGATHRISQGLAAGFTIVLAFLLMPLLQYLPLTVIAAILFLTAIGLIEVERFRHYWEEEKGSLIVGLVVALTTVIEDAGLGVAIGTVLALLLFIDRVTRGSYEASFNLEGKRISVCYNKHIVIPTDPKPDMVIYSVSGVVSYIDVTVHMARLRAISTTPSINTVILRLRNLYNVDVDAADAFEEIVEELRAAGKAVLVTSVNDTMTEILSHHKVFVDLKAAGNWYDKTGDALAALGVEPEKRVVTTPA